MAAAEGGSFQSVADRSSAFMPSLDVITRMVRFGRGGAVLVVQLVQVSQGVGRSTSQIIMRVPVPVPTQSLRNVRAGPVQPELGVDVATSVRSSDSHCRLSPLAGLGQNDLQLSVVDDFHSISVREGLDVGNLDHLPINLGLVLIGDAVSDSLEHQLCSQGVPWGPVMQVHVLEVDLEVSTAGGLVRALPVEIVVLPVKCPARLFAHLSRFRNQLYSICEARTVQASVL